MDRRGFSSSPLMLPPQVLAPPPLLASLLLVMRYLANDFVRSYAYLLRQIVRAVDGTIPLHIAFIVVAGQ